MQQRGRGVREYQALVAVTVPNTRALHKDKAQETRTRNGTPVTSSWSNKANGNNNNNKYNTTMQRLPPYEFLFPENIITQYLTAAIESFSQAFKGSTITNSGKWNASGCVEQSAQQRPALCLLHTRSFTVCVHSVPLHGAHKHPPKKERWKDLHTWTCRRMGSL